MTTDYKHASLEDIRLYLSRNEYPSPLSRGEKSNFRRSAKKYELIENQMFVQKSGHMGYRRRNSRRGVTPEIRHTTSMPNLALKKRGCDTQPVLHWK